MSPRSATAAGPGRPPVRAGAPHGEAAVRASLIASATDLFADRGPRAVTVRQVADAAGVNHGLVHHYFGSKDGLVAAVLEELAARSADEVATAANAAVLYAAGGATERHGRIIAHLLLEGRDVAEFKAAFPTVQLLVERFGREDGVDDDQARARVAQVVALVLGWQLFEPFLGAAAGLDLDGTSRAELLDDAVARLLRR